MLAKFKKQLLILTVVMLLFMIWIGYTSYLICSFGEVNELVETEAAIVLGAAVWDDEPSPVFKGRINHAIWLYENEVVVKWP